MEVVPSVESYAGPKDKHTWLKWTIAALVAILNGYAAVMMYASGEWVFALLDLVVVSVGLYVFMNKKTYAHRYIFPGVAGMVVFIIFPLAYTIGIAFTNYSGTNLLSVEQARDYHLKKTYKVAGGEFDFTLLGGDNGQFQLQLNQDDHAYISQPVTLMNNKARELAVSEGRAQATPQVIELTPVTGEIASKPAPIRAIVDHRTHLSALDLVLPDGSTHLTLSSLRKFAAQKSQYTRLMDGAVLKSGVVIKDSNLLRDNQSGELMLPNGETGFYQYIDDQGQFVGKGIAPGFVVSVGWKNFARIVTDPGIQAPFLQIFVWTVIFSACSVAFTLAIGMVLACLV
ncbi:MAG: maltose ABC transporter permease MalF, partial [Aeromonas jandaei]